jgi:hypothetical protein
MISMILRHSSDRNSSKQMDTDKWEILSRNLLKRITSCKKLCVCIMYHLVNCANKLLDQNLSSYAKRIRTIS